MPVRILSALILSSTLACATLPRSEAALQSTSNGCFAFSTNVKETHKFNEPFKFQLKLERSCIPYRDLERINFDATMPDHHHGMNVVPKIERKDLKTYEITNTQFHMLGYWQLAFEFYYGERVELASIDLEVHPQ